jgi:hypothetical protein
VPPKRPSGSVNFRDAEDVTVAGVIAGKDHGGDDQAHQHHDDCGDKTLGTGKEAEQQAEQHTGDDAGDQEQAAMKTINGRQFIPQATKLKNSDRPNVRRCQAASIGANQ